MCCLRRCQQKINLNSRGGGDPQNHGEEREHRSGELIAAQIKRLARKGTQKKKRGKKRSNYKKTKKKKKRVRRLERGDTIQGLEKKLERLKAQKRIVCRVSMEKGRVCLGEICFPGSVPWEKKGFRFKRELV